MTNSRLLINPNKYIEINTYYSITNNKHDVTVFNVLKNEDGKKTYDKETDLGIEDSERSVFLLTSKWSPMTWQLRNLLRRESQIYNVASEDQEFDPMLYEQKTMEYCLKDWNIFDDNNDQIPPTMENIELLHESIVNDMLGKYYNYSREGDITGDEKKS